MFRFYASTVQRKLTEQSVGLYCVQRTRTAVRVDHVLKNSGGNVTFVTVRPPYLL